MLVERLVAKPKERGDLISVVNEGSRAGWSEYDIVQGILATALYTYEQAKTKKCFYRPVTAYQRKCYDPPVVRALTGPDAFEDEHFHAMICTLQSLLLHCMKPVEHEICGNTAGGGAVATSLAGVLWQHRWRGCGGNIEEHKKDRRTEKR